MKTRTIARLTRLNELRSAGALSDQEFEAEKSKLLAADSSRWPLFAGAGAAVVIAAAPAGMLIMQRGPSGQATLPVAPVVSPLAPMASLVSENLTPTERLTQAFEAATGHSSAFTQSVKGEKFTVTPIKIIELPFGPALLVKREIKDGCHACSGFIGVYYLREDRGQSIVSASFPEAVSGWGWGAAPTEWQITDRFTANPAIYASGGYTGQGVTESSATVTELQPKGPVTSDVIGTGYSDAGAITDDSPHAGCELDGKITNVVKDRSFAVAVSGTVKGIDLFVKRNGKFVAVKKRDWGLPCPVENQASAGGV